MAVYEVLYYDARSGQRQAESDPNVGEAYLDRLAVDGGSAKEVAAAERRDEAQPTRYLLPGSHEWTEAVPQALRDGPQGKPISQRILR